MANELDFDFSSAPGSSSDKSGGSSGPRLAGSVAKPRPEADLGFLNQLNPRQKEAVLHTEGPLIVLAGAGSGKTKMLTSRIAYLIEGCGVPAYQILAVTFTNKAAGEMRERVERMLAHSGSLGAPEIGTFHSVCVRLLRREMDRTPFTKPFVIYDDSDQLTLIKGAIDKAGYDDKSVSPKAIQAAINRAKCDAHEPKDIEITPHNFFQKQFKRVYEQYQKDLFANNALDFGEILCMTYRLLRDNEDIRQKYQRRFRYIHVDEYQDTNRAQYLMLSLLANAKHGGHQNICVVGDEDQSIYKWRGADIRNIMDFESDYPGAKVVKLEQNYRSTKTIVNAASQVIKNNKSRKEKTLWTDNSDGIPIIRAQLPDERAEAEMAVREVKRLSENEGRAYSEFAIFYRTNAQSRVFEDVLRREKIPYQIIGGLRFYDRKEIKDILAYFKVILNPSDSVNLKRIINVPARGIGKTTIEKIDEIFAEMQANAGATGDQGELLSSAHGEPVVTYWDALLRAAREPSLTSASTARKLNVFVALMDRLMEEQPKLLLSELYHLILDETGYVLELRKEGTEEALARVENLEEFNSLLQEFEEDEFEDLPEEEQKAKKPFLLPLFIEASSLASDVDQLDGHVPSIKLMTLHSSKGLEFPVVFLVGMEEGLFPSTKPWEESNEEDIEEERRLCYVGMTRARESLYLMNVLIRRIWGNVAYQEPSRFFIEIPDELMDFKDFANVSTSSSRLGSSRQFGYRSSSPSVRRSSDFSQEVRPAELRANDLVGQKLDHPEYGLGTILSVEGSGDDRKVTIEFRGRDRRKFLWRYLASYFGD